MANALRTLTHARARGRGRSQVPSARRAVEAGNTCLRKTLAGVDLNRNWPVAWRKGADPSSEEYGGPAPLSEPQSRALAALVAGLANVAGYVQVHSGEWAMYVPWDHTKAEALGLPGDTHALLDVMNAQCQCTRGAGGAASSYLAYGTSMDYMWLGACARCRPSANGPSVPARVTSIPDVLTRGVASQSWGCRTR